MRLIPALFIALVAASAAACSSVPPVSAKPASPMASDSGMVIGTLSYQYLDVNSPRSAGVWVVHFDRVDRAAAQQNYVLAVNLDPNSNSGVFTGALPAGVYAFREASSANRRFAVGALKMPFEVQAGAVQDAGHYALAPLN